MNVPRPSGTCATPRRTTSSVAMPRSRSPSKRISPSAQHAADRPQRRRLAGAVGAQQRGHAALRDREIDAVQHPRLAVPGVQALLQQSLKQRAQHVVSSSCVCRDRRGSLPALLAPASGAPSAIFCRIQRHHFAGDPHHQAHVMLDQQDAERELLADAPQQARQFIDLSVIEAAGRFVEQQQLRVGRSARARVRPAFGDPNGQAPAGASRPARRSSRASIARAGARPPPLSRRASGSRSALAMKPERPSVCAPIRMLSRTLMLRNRARFWKVRPSRGRAMRWRGMCETACPRTGCRPQRAADAADGVEQRGLAGAVRADQPANLAVADRERHPIQGGNLAEPHHHVAHAQQRGGAIVAHQVRGRRGAMRRPVTPLFLPECLKRWHAGTLAGKRAAPSSLQMLG